MRSLCVVFAAFALFAAVGCPTSSPPTSTATTAEAAPVAHGTVEHMCEQAAEGFDCTGCAAHAGGDPMQTPSCMREDSSCPLACCGLCAKE
jgi:hypothetical protein